MGRRNSRQEVVGSVVTEMDKKPNCDGNNMYLKYQLMLSKVKIFYPYKEDKVHTTELHKFKAFPRYE